MHGLIGWRHGGLAGHDPRGLILLGLAAVLVEIAWRLRFARRGYDARGAAATLGVGAGNIVSGAITSVALAAIYAAAWRLAPVHWPLADWRTWAIGFVVVEFAYYWFHRFSHEVRWLWATHSVHHTPEQVTLLSAVRLGWTNLVSCGWVVYLPVVLAGFDPRLVLGLLAFDLRYQFFLHTEATIKLGPLEWILNTPAHHLVHHARNPSCLDRNYGGIVIVFDRMFGTFAKAPADEPLRYGLAAGVPSYNPLRIALGEWIAIARDVRAATSPASALRAAFGRP